ncbi:hypothetical protein LINPERHAP1_LOCUS35014, partial [Linum perenne]
FRDRPPFTFFKSLRMSILHFLFHSSPLFVRHDFVIRVHHFSSKAECQRSLVN